MVSSKSVFVAMNISARLLELETKFAYSVFCVQLIFSLSPEKFSRRKLMIRATIEVLFRTLPPSLLLLLSPSLSPHPLSLPLSLCPQFPGKSECDCCRRCMCVRVCAESCF